MDTEVGFPSSTSRFARQRGPPNAIESTPRVLIVYSVAQTYGPRRLALRNGLLGTARHPQAALPAKTVEATFAESVS